MAGDKFNPITASPIPWKVNKRDVWHSVVAADGKTVCNCRNILDAEMIVKKCNIADVSGRSEQLKAFGDWLIKEKYCLENPMEDLITEYFESL